MKLFLPEISWHSRDPIYSVDFCQGGDLGLCRLATASCDGNVRIWELKFSDCNGIIDSEKKVKDVEFRATLSRHHHPVNVVRFAPKSQDVVASGDVDGTLIVWRRSECRGRAVSPDDSVAETPGLETWNVQQLGRPHMNDICDLCWAPDGTRIASVSVDKSLAVWSVLSGSTLTLMKGFSQFPNGVSWDPLGRIFVSLGNDKELQIFDAVKLKRLERVSKAKLPCFGQTQLRLYHDDSLMTFVRRPDFSPDGQILITPAGALEPGEGKSTMNVSYVFMRDNWRTPCLLLPSDKPSLVVRVCPVVFRLFPGVQNLFQLPYRLVFAVLTRDSVMFYHSQQLLPFALVSDIHYGPLTDISWAKDGQTFVVSSIDGYCSIVRFGTEDLGEPSDEALELPTPAESPAPRKRTPKSATNSAKSTPTTPSSTRPRFRKTPNIKDFFAKASDASEPKPVEQTISPPKEESAPSVAGAPPKKAPRRVNFITLSPSVSGVAMKGVEDNPKPCLQPPQ